MGRSRRHNKPAAPTRPTAARLRALAGWVRGCERLASDSATRLCPRAWHAWHLIVAAALLCALPGVSEAQKRCEPCFAVPYFTVNATGTNKVSNDQFNVMATVGEIEADIVVTTDPSLRIGASIATGFWGHYLAEPFGPDVQATDGDFLDRVELSWEVPEQRTGPPVTGTKQTILRNGSTLATVDLIDGKTQYEFQDFNVFPGEEYEYAIQTSNNLGLSHDDIDIGFLEPNGTISGNIITRNGNPVKDVEVVLTPSLGRSANFEVDDYIYFPDMVSGLEASYTIEGWFRSILAQEQTLFAVVDSATTRPFVRIRIDADGKVRWEHRGAGSAADDVVTTPVPYTDDGEWHHFAAVLADSNNSMTLYLDGLIVGRGTATDLIGAQRAQAVLAKRGPVQHEEYFQGRLDDWRIWSAPKPRPDIRRDMNRTLEGDEAGLAAYWKFDEVKGEIAFDLTANDNDGVICGVERSQLLAPVFVSGITDEFGNYSIRSIFYGTETTFTATPQKVTPVGRSLKFDGVDDFVGFPRNRLDLTGGYTWEGWFKHPGGTGPHTIVAAVNPADDADQVRLELLDDGRLQLIQMGVVLTSAGRYDTEFWFHFAVTHDLDSGTLTHDLDSGTLTLYLDGEVLGSAAAPVVPTLSSYVVGRRAPKVDDDYYVGWLDEFRVWDRGRTEEQVNAVRSQVLVGNETGMVAYWKMNEGDGVLVTDATGNGQTGEIFHEIDDAGDPVILEDGTISKLAAWTDDIPLNEVFENTFDPESRQVLLNTANTTVERVDFIDISQIGVSGFVKYSKTACFIGGAEILVNGLPVFPPRFTDDEGKFVVEFEPGAQRQQISVRYREHEIVPAFVELPTIVSPISGLFFEDKATHSVGGKVVGGVCEYPITPTQGQIEVTYRSVDGCIERTVVPDPANGNLAPIDLPPVIFQLFLDHPDPEIDAFFTADTLSLEESDRQVEFVYRAPPEVSITGFPVNSCGLREIAQSQIVDLEIQVFESYSSQGVIQTCQADSGSLRIDDNTGHAAAQVDTDFAFEGNVTSYTHEVRHAEPNITGGGAHPYQKSIQATATDALGRTGAVEEWTYVTGLRPRSLDFATTAPDIPFFILRDPPGDQSYSYLEEGETVATSLSFSQLDEAFAEVSATVHLGPDFKFGSGATGGLVPVAYAELDAIDVTADFTAEFGLNISQSRSSEQTWSFTATERFSTTGAGDVYVGAALNVLYGITDVFSLDDACQPVLDEDLFFNPAGFDTKFIYSESFLLESVIHELELIANSDAPTVTDEDRANARQSADAWLGHIARNKALKEGAGELIELPFDLLDTARQFLGLAPPPSLILDQVTALGESQGLLVPNDLETVRNVSFDAGASFESSQTLSTTSTLSADYELELEASIAVAAGATAAGVGVSGKAKIGIRTHLGQSISQSTAQTTTTGFVLADDDPGDNFSVDILNDGAYNTPVFRVRSATVSCPYEPEWGDDVLIAVDNPVLAISPAQQVNVPPDEAAVFNLILGNSSEAGLDREYGVSVQQDSNPDGAQIAINGVVVEDALTFDVPFGEAITAAIEVFRGPQEYTYNDIELQAFSPCEANPELSTRVGLLGGTLHQFDEASLSVQYKVPCSEAVIAVPEDNWLVTAADQANALQVTLNGYDREDPNLERIEVQYRPAVGGDWFVAASVPKDDPGDGTPHLAEDFVLVDWEINPAVVPDNEYELRAIALCGLGLTSGISPVVRGTIDREGPRLLGLPEPSDGILDPDDLISIRYNEDINCGEISLGNGDITLHNTVTGQAVDFTHTCGGNEVVIDPNVQNTFLENQTLRASVGPLRDLFGNLQSEPEQWEFFVNRNPIAWDPLDISDIVIFEDEIFSTTRLLNNTGGSNRSYELTEVPSWLDVTPVEGTILPGEATTVTFSVDGSKVGNGDFRKTIFASGTQGNEPRLVDVRVLCYPPDWGVVNPIDFQHSMTLTARLSTDGELSDDAYDRVGVFLDGQLHGVGQVEFVREFEDLANTHPYEVFLTIYGNDDALARDLELRVWDASACQELGMVTETYRFQPNLIAGTPTTPVQITATSEIIGSFDFPDGWTWFSTNLESADMSTDSVLGDLQLQTGATGTNIVRGQRQFSQFVDQVGWIGNLNELTNTSMYLLNLANSATLEMIGFAVNVETTHIPVERGWNWIGFLPQQAMEINRALESLPSLTGDIIKSQFEFAQFVEGLGWIGSMSFMNPQLGYQLLAHEAGTLAYPFFEGDPPAKPAPIVAPGLLAWRMDQRHYPDNMTIIAELTGEDIEVDRSADGVAAFVEGELRGVGRIVTLPEQDRTLAFLVVSGTDGESEAGAVVEFRFFDASEGLERFVPTEVEFETNAALGSIEEPVALLTRERRLGDRGYVPDRFMLSQAFPNPFNPSTRFGYGLPRDGQVEIAIYNALGQKVRTLIDQVEPAGYRYATWDGRDDDGRSVTSGLYFYAMQAEGFREVKKVLLLK